MFGSALEVAFTAALSSFFTLVLLGLFNLLKLKLPIHPRRWIPPPAPSYNFLFEDDRRSLPSHPRGPAQDLYGFPPKNKYYAVVLDAFNKFMEAVNGTEREGWKYIGDKKGVKRYRKMLSTSPIPTYRGEKVLPYPVHVCFNAIKSEHCRRNLSDQMDQLGTLEVVDDNVRVIYEAFKPPAPFIAAREMVYVDCIHKLDDGTIISFGKSVDHAARRVSDKYARATLLISGWAFKPVPKEPGQTKVINLARCDFGGSVPKYVTDRISSEISMTVEKLHAYLKKYQGETRYDAPLPGVLIHGPNKWYQMQMQAMQAQQQQQQQQMQAQAQELKERDENEMGAVPDDTEEKTNLSARMGANGAHAAHARVGGLASRSAGELPRRERKGMNGMTWEEMKLRFDAAKRDENFFSSEEYLNLIPRNKDWIYNQLLLKPKQRHYMSSVSYDVSKFVPHDRGTHRFSEDLDAAFEIFREWRSWCNGPEWTERQRKPELKIYSRSVPSEPLDVLKGESVFPYSAPVVAGMLVNLDHRQKWDKKMDEIRLVETLSPHSRVVYVSVKTPFFITYRDMVALASVYHLDDGGFLLLTRSVAHEQEPERKTRVRAFCKLAMWHLEPNWELSREKQKPHTNVTYYTHMDLGGSLPDWLVNEASTDLPNSVVKVLDYMNQLRAQLHKPGVLHIPPLALQQMGVDIKHLDPALYEEEKLSDTNEEQEQEQEQATEGRNGVGAIEEAKDGMNARNGMNGHESRGQERNEMNSVATTQGNGVLPAAVAAAAQTGRNGVNSSVGGRATSPVLSAQSQSQSQRRLYPKPNMNIMNQQQPLLAPNLQNLQQNSAHGTHDHKANGFGPHATKPTVKFSSNIVTRDGWAVGQTIRVQDITTTPSLAKGGAAVVSRVHSASNVSNNNNHNNSHSTRGGRGSNAPQHYSTYTNVLSPQISTPDASQSHAFAMSPMTTLSVRDAASYLTLANIAVSDLLQQADPSSKQYWEPSTTQSPKGIFVYKFVHNMNKKYHHYMGKAILRHEPKFIYDALVDPTFRFHYDKMLDSMQVVEKLDTDTVIQRMTHVSKQCYVATRRESVVVVRHRAVCEGDKYVVAGMSVQHPAFPSDQAPPQQQIQQMQHVQHVQQMAQHAEGRDTRNGPDGRDGRDRGLSAEMSGNNVISGIPGINGNGSELGREASLTDGDGMGLTRNGSDGTGRESGGNGSYTQQQQYQRYAYQKGKKGMVRMDIKSSGWVIERNVKKPSDSIVSYITNMNIGGSIPSAIRKNLAKKQPLCIYYLGKALRKRQQRMREERKRMERMKQEEESGMRGVPQGQQGQGQGNEMHVTSGQGMGPK